VASNPGGFFRQIPQHGTGDVDAIACWYGLAQQGQRLIVCEKYANLHALHRTLTASPPQSKHVEGRQCEQDWLIQRLACCVSVKNRLMGNEAGRLEMRQVPVNSGMIIWMFLA